MRKIILASVLSLAWAPWAWAQTPTPAAQADTIRTVPPVINQPHVPNASGAAAAGQISGEGEIDLEAIEIQAVVEKPNVDIIPKRARPEWEETRFIERSFETELKQAPKDLMIVDDELDRAQKLDALKKNDPPKKK